ncbi:membrane-bound PQQ-dependent dehydrogenase, glucose/quinate/shikimate family [Acinetobacter guerrae]|uniref:Membrane-bound PQQ-dependent dehydrogenase, glucose/quinate/shikimate family n=1 Tax=Acinetobacter guerrae TaxID=1843371 RepID=A0A3A8EUS5_9GAMM|nr:membrane-bound PQQ-dependent dehydrogenase, glucose/quinate/shikimate family [Acinetobacter guerrae]RKG34460.1 membrane-bound PQQ-dependent dehydrogenase, glucose/quinate/shikimate family [Acinetobacter guerrae]
MKIIRFLIILVTLFTSLFLIIGGISLISAGGSFYYFLLGLIYLASSFLLYKNKALGFYLVIIALVITFLWAIYERGFAYWPMLARIMVPLGLAFVALYALRKEHYNAKTLGFSLGSLVIFIGMAIAAFFSHDVQYANGKSYQAHTPFGMPENWTAYGRTNAGTRFSPFTLINRDNVKNLQVAWTYHTGDKGPGIDQNTPLQVDNLLYSCSRNGIIAALDVDTGKSVWKFDANGRSPIWQRCRGLGYFDARQANLTQSIAATAAQGANQAQCQQRIVQTTNDARLLELDAKTGQPCQEFGQQGYVDLKTGMGDVKPGFYFQTSAPLVANDTIVIGGWVVDNQEVGEPSGVIRGFDAKTGALKWAWDLGNPAIDKLPPTGQTYTRGTPNSWSTLSYDDKLGLVYVPLGNNTPDYYGRERPEFSNKYNSSLVALDVRTGKEKWHFQTTHYDLWDYDLPSQPALMDVPDQNGQIVPAVMQTTKRGQIFLLNRETGTPIADVVEKPVPSKSPIPDEKPLSPTQPYSVGMPTIGADHLNEKKIWGVTLFDQLVCRIQFKKMSYEGDFTPVGFNKTLEQPGNLGGMNWGSVAYDAKNQIAYMNDIRIPSVFWLVKRDEFAKVSKKYPSDGTGHGPSPQTGTPYGMVTMMWTSAMETPCTEPPFGTISAIDMKSKQVLWQVPVGTTKDLGPWGIKSHIPLAMGMPTYAGTSVTAGGVLFFAGSQDYYLRAYDAATGQEIWKYRLPIGASATPMTYVSPQTGKQYIVVSVGGAAHSNEVGDYVMAFALKQ